MIVIVGLPNLGIYYSTDAGVNCYTSSAPALFWNVVATSANGRRMVAAASPGLVFFSGDFGATWTPINLPSQNWNSVCMSSDGRWMAAISTTDSYISSNLGVSWRTNHLAGNRIACSANGTCWLISGPLVYTSTNSASTWQTNFSSGEWYAAAVSADGCEMIASGGGRGLCLAASRLPRN